jgi:acetaldehyde dehydrogenase/alcohol dehydrogenase
MPRSLRETGIAADAWSAAMPELCRAAFADPSGRTNPRMPLLTELHDLLQAGFEGR